MPTSVINEILSFCPQGTIASGDIMALEDYKNDVQRLRGHQPGIARRELENMALRQSSFVAAGLAQFVAKRYVPGVRDDADLDARCCGGFDLLGVGLQHLGGKPVFLSALQRFAAQFQEYSLVFHRGSRFIVVRR